MSEDINKIAIIGGPGTGKSTLANNLGRKLNLPICHLDSINYFGNWVERDKKERDNIILQKVSEPKWVMDGTYNSTLEERVQKSDLTIFLRYSTLAKMKGILYRYFNNKGIEKKDIPGCREQMTWKFLKFSYNWNRKKLKFIDDILEKNNNKKIIIFKNRKDLNKWYLEKFGEQIQLQK